MVPAEFVSAALDLGACRKRLPLQRGSLPKIWIALVPAEDAPKQVYEKQNLRRHGHKRSNANEDLQRKQLMNVVYFG